jgi:DNA-binding transcriptional ArsR family regulator
MGKTNQAASVKHRVPNTGPAIVVFHQDMVDLATGSLPPQEDLEDLGEFFKVLTDPTRLKILYALGAGELCVFDLSVSIGASVSSVSHHLSALKRVRLVKARRDGRIIYYSPDDNHVKTIIQYALAHLGERR